MTNEKIEFGLYIDGALIAPRAGTMTTVFEPATGKKLADVALAGEEDIDAAVNAARTALPTWRRASASRRSQLLHRLADLIDEQAEELVDLETRNVGKAISSVRAEVGAASATLRFYAGAVSGIEGRAATVGGSILTYSLKEPVGVCAQIVPWNYPLTMAILKIAPALAAGCTIVLKPDPATPLSALKVAELATEAGIPAGVLNIVPADGPTVGNYLVGHPGVDKVAFTGSTASGARVMATAAQTIKRVSLELGGKSPSLIFSDADLGSAVPAAVWSVYSAAGQSCEARSRVLIERSIFDEAVELFIHHAGRLRVGDPLDPATQIGSLISAEHRAKVHGFVDSAVNEGGELLCGGTVPGGPGSFYLPTAIVDWQNSLSIERQEIFGPVATLVPFEDEKHAVSMANETDYGLMATVWTTDSARGPRMATKIDAGTIGINLPYTSMPGVPFGGYKQSGFGRELAVETLEHYLETKSVMSWMHSTPSNPLA